MGIMRVYNVRGVLYTNLASTSLIQQMYTYVIIHIILRYNNVGTRIGTNSSNKIQPVRVHK